MYFHLNLYLYFISLLCLVKVDETNKCIQPLSFSSELMYFFLISYNIWRNIQLHHQLSKSCVGAQIWILSLSCPSGLAVAQYLPHILWPTDIDNECKRSLGSDRDYPQHLDLEGCFARILPTAVRASNEWGKSWTRHDMQRGGGTALCWLRICFQSMPLIWIPAQHLETLLLALFIQNASSSICLKCII